mmetsp:Transcript_11855/g.25258  ORF Transcript_11855/g.25258 Transcript_11855/m.25258 type:complete len:126 (-) Transcript_11855:297-674(-)
MLTACAEHKLDKEREREQRRPEREREDRNRTIGWKRSRNLKKKQCAAETRAKHVARPPGLDEDCISTALFAVFRRRSDVRDGGWENVPRYAVLLRARIRAQIAEWRCKRARTNIFKMLLVFIRSQ